MKARKKPNIIEIDMGKLADVLRRAEAALDAKDYETLKAFVASHAYLTELVADKEMSLARLRKIVFGARTEKTAAVIGRGKDSEPSQPPGAAESADSPTDVPEKEAAAEAEPKPKRPGHGRNGAKAYYGAEKIPVGHSTLRAGDPCPGCTKGTVYRMASPAVLVRVTGHAPLQAKVYELERLRCNLCGTIFTADAPKGVGSAKYDATSASMIGLLKYGTGMPFNRFQGMQGHLGIPLPASTQWDIIHNRVQYFEPIHAELAYLAAQGDVLHNDDTPAKILTLMGRRAEQAAAAARASGQEDASKRKGLFTTGIVSLWEEHRIAIFFSGRKHAGENLKDVLAQRIAELGAPIQMCDALSRNVPDELGTIVANCLAHGRRKFVDVAAYFPGECEYVLEALKVVYHNDAMARERNLSPEARLAFHQTESGPAMQALHAWLGRQLAERLVEPNSGLGTAIAYMLRHWPELTLFLRQAGAPLDNNICERALKKAILHRKNSLFYKTEKGARVGDIYMSLIYTCELCGANPFDYLTELQRHASEVASKPRSWLPWNYRQTLDATFQPSAVAAS